MKTQKTIAVVTIATVTECGDYIGSRTETYATRESATAALCGEGFVRQDVAGDEWERMFDSGAYLYASIQETQLL